MEKIKAAIILDNCTLTEWQSAALVEASELLDIRVILNCKNTVIKKKPFTHGLYYLLNIFALKNKFTKPRRYDVNKEKLINFNSEYDGSWQRLPENISNLLIDESISVVIKFGMSLLRIERALKEIPVLSYHHGNPSEFRGRPAGFYELLFNAEKLGVIVQRLSNKLDGGDILAFAESKLLRHSYRKTAEGFYSISKFLLKKALVNLYNQRYISIETEGKNYRLPSNSTVIKFAFILQFRKLQHILYGAFFEKKWKVGLISMSPEFKSDVQLTEKKLSTFTIESGYNFYADPFFSADGKKVRLEALGNKSGLGDIIEIDLEEKEQNKLLLCGEHYSYPLSFTHEGREMLLPEVASHSAQYYIELPNYDRKFFLKGLESKRLADATLLEFEGYWYLFFGENKHAHTYLNLWFSKSLSEPFIQHPKSPVCISPSSARMGGRILKKDQELFRFGQNNNRGYGANLTTSLIVKLSPHDYEEVVCGSVSIDNCYGPHSLDYNEHSGLAVIDYYKNEFSLFAGVRRFKALVSKV